MFSEIIQKFADKTPVTLMVQALLENLLNPIKIDEWFESVRESQYTRNILFSSIVAIMLSVVCRSRSSVHSAYMNTNGIHGSVVALYDKLKLIETKTSRELVKYIGNQCELIIRNINGMNKSWLPGYRIKILDGNCIESTEHRIQVLRDTPAGALPGKCWVVFEPELGIVTDVIPCEDGHAQERSLLKQIIDTVMPNDLWIADRNFCVLGFLFSIISKKASFIIRQHKNMPYKVLTKLKYIKNTETGMVYEQNVLIRAESGEQEKIRRIVIKLYKPTRNGDHEIGLFMNLPKKDADSIKISTLYKERWNVETAFQKLENHLQSEINTLGYPKAALFGFCIALVAFNVYAVVMAALQAANPDKNIKDEVSEYYISEEISSTQEGMLVAIDHADFNIFRECNLEKFGLMLLYLASNVQLSKFKKHKRGPKKSRIPRTKFKGKPHVSTARLLISEGKE